MPEAMSVYDMRIEDRLLLVCSSPKMKPAAISQVRDSVGGGVEWNYFVSRAQQHAVLPLVARNLQSHFRDLLPDAASNILTGASWEGMRRNLTLTAELFRILGLFAKVGIEVIPFKGPTLAVAAY